jgi:hypothetical protein
MAEDEIILGQRYLQHHVVKLLLFTLQDHKIS